MWRLFKKTEMKNMSEEIVRNVNKSRTVGWAHLPVAHSCNHLILRGFDSLKNQ